MQIETVKVVDSHSSSQTGYKIINKSDMTDADKLYEEPKQAAPVDPGAGNQQSAQHHKNNRR